MKNKTVLIILFCSMLLLAWKMYANKNISLPYKSAPKDKATVRTYPPPPTDNEVISLVDTFETYQMARKSREVMELFTPPNNEADAEQYAFIMGQDIVYPRVFVTHGLQSCVKSYKVVSIKQTESGASVTVNENRCQKDNTSANVSYADVKLILELKRTGLNIVIDKYYSANSDKIKYQGFYE